MSWSLSRLHEIYPQSSAALMPLGLRVNDIVFTGSVTGTDAGNVRIGPLVFAPALMPIEPGAERIVEGNMEEQLRQVLQNMDQLLATAGGDRRHVARVTLFMSDVSDRTAMNKVWREWFPDPTDRPPHKYVPVPLPRGIVASAQVIALIGSHRQVIQISGLEHRDWMSLAARQGNLVTSSRIVGTDPTTGTSSQDPREYTVQAFENAAEVLRLAGGGWENVTQLTAFIGEEDLRPLVEEQWHRRIGGERDDCQLHLRVTDLGGQSVLPRLELLAILRD